MRLEGSQANSLTVLQSNSLTGEQSDRLTDKIKK